MYGSARLQVLGGLGGLGGLRGLGGLGGWGGFREVSLSGRLLSKTGARRHKDD